jgi:hypothetical protein
MHIPDSPQIHTKNPDPSSTGMKQSTQMSAVHLPVTVYSFDRRAKLYRLVECLQCAVPCMTPPKVLTCSAGLGMLGENIELLKAAMQTPAIVLQNGTRTKTLNASGDEVAVLPPTQR